jgi:hypothetical protein
MGLNLTSQPHISCKHEFILLIYDYVLEIKIFLSNNLLSSLHMESAFMHGNYVLEDIEPKHFNKMSSAFSYVL